MRIKFNKGITPEVMAENFLKIIKEHGKLVSSADMYVRFYDENMKLDKDTIMITCSPKDVETEAYSEYAAEKRREFMKVVNE